MAAAVIWPQELESAEINDSKQLTPIARERLFSFISANAVGIGVGMCDQDEIDALGVGRATHVAMQRAIDNLECSADLILVDGYKVNFRDVVSAGVIKGDSVYLCIAAASIVAKVTRDRMMTELHGRYPRYGFAIHKGYGTALHQERLGIYGACKIHRRSFGPIRALVADSSQAVLAGESLA